jgi:hypothetical protein
VSSTNSIKNTRKHTTKTRAPDSRMKPVLAEPLSSNAVTGSDIINENEGRRGTEKGRQSKATYSDFIKITC